MREFLSKSIAGGLSAGVVLLWWPVLFEEVDTVTSWLVRGVAWTVCFELLLVALLPFERALWETTRGERITGRVGAAGSRLHAGPARSRIGRLSAVATAALIVPVALLVMGLHEHAPASAEAKPVAPTKVVRVTKVVNVKRIVERAPIPAPPVVEAEQPTGVAPVPVSPAPTGGVVVERTAPVERESAGKPAPGVREEPAQACEGDDCEAAGSPTP